MAECYCKKGMMKLPYSEQLNIAPLNRIFDNKSECYKLFWFQAILNFVKKGTTVITYEELINEMIADAWYMVTEYHLNLGPNDTLEKIVLRISEISELRPSENKEKLLQYLRECRDPVVLRYKSTLTNMVPYRLHAPFVSEKSSVIYDSPGGLSCLIERLNNQPDLIYYFSQPKRMETEIYVQDTWAEYLQVNYEIIQGWIQLHMVEYLQRRNPAVPGILDKLYPPTERKLEDIKRYWKVLINWRPVHEIYQGKLVTADDISIDHFVPWSYVAHDELWNLHPTTRSINSKKGNRLPRWNEYFPLFADIEYYAYQGMNESALVKAEFDKCAKLHLNNDGVKTLLYEKGQSRNEFAVKLEKVVRPVYAEAVNCGFSVWDGV